MGTCFHVEVQESVLVPTEDALLSKESVDTTDMQQAIGIATALQSKDSSAWGKTMKRAARMAEAILKGQPLETISKNVYSIALSMRKERRFNFTAMQVNRKPENVILCPMEGDTASWVMEISDKACEVERMDNKLVEPQVAPLPEAEP